jgi:L-ascorbate metabolism protein UlaG (beta-lactamase superfamily)
VLLLCVVGRQGSPRFVERLLRAVRPKLVLPCHWDDFTVGFSHGPRELRRVDLEGFLREVDAAGTGTEARILDFFGECRFLAAAPPPPPSTSGR